MGPITPFPSTTPHRFLDYAVAMQNRSLERLSTGLRINRAADDPAGLVSSEHLRTQLEQLDAESRALSRAEHISATADASMGVAADLLVEAEGLAVAAANTAGMSDAEREAYQMQMDSVVQSVARIAATTTFNGTPLMDGSFSVSVGDASVSVPSADPSDLGRIDDGAGGTHTLADTGSGGAINLVNGDIGAAQDSIRAARSQLTSAQGRLGAFVKHTIGPAWTANRIAFENTTAAHSMIRDADFAAEAANLARGGLLAAASMGAMMVDRARAETVLTLLG